MPPSANGPAQEGRRHSIKLDDFHVFIEDKSNDRVLCIAMFQLCQVVFCHSCCAHPFAKRQPVPSPARTSGGRWASSLCRPTIPTAARTSGGRPSSFSRRATIPLLTRPREFADHPLGDKDVGRPAVLLLTLANHLVGEDLAILSPARSLDHPLAGKNLGWPACHPLALTDNPLAGEDLRRVAGLLLPRADHPLAGKDLRRPSGLFLAPAYHLLAGEDLGRPGCQRGPWAGGLSTPRAGRPSPR